MHRFTRRRALHMAGVLAAGGSLRSLAESFPQSRQTPQDGTRLYAVMREDAGAGAGLAYFLRRGDTWDRQQLLAAPFAAQLIAAPCGQHVLVTHAAEDTRHAAGFVETLRIHPRTGALTRGTKRALALSSRTPRSLASSTDGRMLVVASAEGVLSLLHMHADGAIGEVIAAHKHLALAPMLHGPVHMAFRSAAQLQIQCGTDVFHYACSPDGIQYAGSGRAAAAIRSHATEDLPAGVVSSVLLPTLPA